MRKNKSSDLSQEAYITLKKMILKGELLPGDKLNQVLLAEKLGVSRTPLIAAFSKLQKENIVQIIPHRGVYVKRFNVKEILDIYNIRLQLEPLGAFEASQNITPERIVTLSTILEKYEKAIASGDSKELEWIDADFHLEIMRYSNNKFLYDMLNNFNIIIISNRIGILNKEEKSLKDHRFLIEAISRQDGQEARRIMHQHIKNARDNLQKLSMLNKTFIKIN